MQVDQRGNFPDSLDEFVQLIAATKKGQKRSRNGNDNLDKDNAPKIKKAKTNPAVSKTSVVIPQDKSITYNREVDEENIDFEVQQPDDKAITEPELPEAINELEEEAIGESAQPTVVNNIIQELIAIKHECLHDMARPEATENSGSDNDGDIEMSDDDEEGDNGLNYTFKFHKDGTPYISLEAQLLIRDVFRQRGIVLPPYKPGQTKTTKTKDPGLHPALVEFRKKLSALQTQVAKTITDGRLDTMAEVTKLLNRIFGKGVKLGHI